MPRRSVIIRSFAFGNVMIRPRFVMGFTLERFQPLQWRQARIRSLASNTVTTDAWLRLKKNSRLVVRTTCDGMLPRWRQRGLHIRHVGLMPQRRLPGFQHRALGLNLGRSHTRRFGSNSFIKSSFQSGFFIGLVPVWLKVFVSRIRASRKLILGSCRSIFRHSHECFLRLNHVSKIRD